MPAVFISYAREDKGFVRRLCEALKQRNKDAWVDLDSILPSAEWHQEIVAAIEGADAVLQIISPYSIGSKSCSDELDCALKNNKRIIPILYEQVDESTLPKNIRDRQWVFLQDSDNFDLGIASLVTALDTNIEWVRAHTRLLTRAVEWDDHNRDYSYALRGSDLKKAESALASGDHFEPRLLPLQIDYILASRKAATKRVALAAVAGIAAVLSIVIFGALFTVKRQESALNLAANFREMGISELASRNPLAAEVLFAKALSITDNVGARERLVEARSQSPRLLWIHTPSDTKSAMLAISSDGVLFVTATPLEVAVWSVPERKQIRVFRMKLDFQAKPLAAFGQAHRLLAIASANKAEVWDLTSSSEQPLDIVATKSEISSLGISADDSLIVGEGDGSVSVWKINQHGEAAPRRLLGHSDRITGTVTSSDSKILISGSWDETAKVWDLQQGTNTETFTGHDDALLCVAISPDGKLVASAGWDDTIWIWDRKSGKGIRALTGHKGSIVALAFSPDGRWLASGSEDHTARLWDVERGRLVLALPGYLGGVSSIAFLGFNGEQDLVTGDSTGLIRLWDLSVIGQRRELETLEGHAGAVTMIAFDPTAPLIASSSVDRSINLWNRETGKLIKSFAGQPGNVSAVAFSPDGKLLICAMKTGSILGWSVADGGERVFKDPDPDARIRHAAFSPNGQFLAGGSEDGRIRIWNVSTGNIVTSFAAHTAKIQGLQFSPDGSLLASSSEDSTVKLWDSNDWKLRNTLIGHQSGVYEIGFSPDGRLLLSGSDDDTARLWDVASGKEVMKPIQLGSPVWAVEFGPDGKTIVTGTEDSTLQFWEISTSASTTMTLHDHFSLRISNGPIWWLRFSEHSGSTELAIASQDKTIRILHLDRLQQLFSDPRTLESDAERRGGLLIGQSPSGEPEVASMSATEFSRQQVQN